VGAILPFFALIFSVFSHSYSYRKMAQGVKSADEIYAFRACSQKIAISTSYRKSG